MQLGLRAVQISAQLAHLGGIGEIWGRYRIQISAQLVHLVRLGVRVRIKARGRGTVRVRIRVLGRSSRTSRAPSPCEVRRMGSARSQLSTAAGN